jgi:hypothetical protein
LFFVFLALFFGGETGINVLSVHVCNSAFDSVGDSSVAASSLLLQS